MRIVLEEQEFDNHSERIITYTHFLLIRMCFWRHKCKNVMYGKCTVPSTLCFVRKWEAFSSLDANAG